MANKTTNYKLTKPLESEFYDVGVQNENMDKIDTQMKANADAVEALQKGQSGKADLVDGKVPAEQLPNMNYDPKGTAQNKVREHNLDQTAHPYLLNQIGTCVEAAQNAQDTANAALDAVSGIVYTINVLPSQNGTLTYNGQAQSPSWNAYNPDALTLGGVTTGTNAGTYTATFTPKGKYKWADGTQTAKEVTWTISAATMTIPTQSNSLTYTGSAQSPAWNNYDSGKMTLGGTTSGTNAGSYNATFTPKTNYKWADGSAEAKTVAWSIAKAAGSLSLNKTSIKLTAAKTTDTITVTRAGDGKITATSSASTVASVSVSGSVVTVTAKSKGKATITVSVAAGTNHTAPANKTCSVEVTLPTKVLNDNSWATIREVSSAGLGANYWAVGDVKEIKINGKVGNTTFSNLAVNTFILGFNHNSAREGGNKIHFQIGKIGSAAVALCDSKYNTNISGTGYFSWNTSNTNSGGWNACYKRKTLYGNDGTPTSPLANSLMAALPSDLRAVMQPVTKYTDNTGNGSNSSGNVTTTTDYLFDLSEFEVFGTRNYANQYEQNYQAQYDYYKAGNTKIANNHAAVTTAVWWGLRSPRYNGTGTFVVVWTDGNYNITLPIILVGCGPALPPNPPQDDPAPIPPPQGGGSGREPQIKIIMAA